MAESWIIGYELTAQAAQISFYNAKMKEPESADLSLGLEKFQIPAVLLKLPGTEGYVCGQEALRAAREGRGVLLDNLIIEAMMSCRGEEHPLGGDPKELLALFIRRSLRLVSTDCTPENISRIVFTLPDLHPGIISVMEEVIRLLGFSEEQASLQDYQESFYYYVIHQKQELRAYHVALFHCEKYHLEAYDLFVHRKSFSKVVTVHPAGELSFVPEDKSVMSRGEAADREKDAAFLHFIEEMFRSNIFSTVYLTGDGFDTDWYAQSLKLLCRGRRVFSGKNLYVKGACYRAMDEANAARGMEFLFMGKHKITHNIGMDVFRNGRKEYFGIISAGVNWFEAKGSCEFLLDKEESIELCIQTIDRSETRKIRVPLDGLPKRPNKTTRLRLSITFTGVRECRIDVKDCGFGEWFPASDFTWTERLKL